MTRWEFDRIGWSTGQGGGTLKIRVNPTKIRDYQSHPIQSDNSASSYIFPTFHFKVNPGSKAGTACLREGDLISSINGIPTFTLTREEAKQQINLDSETLELQLNQPHDNGSPGKRGIRGSLRRLARTLSKGKASDF